MSNDTEWWDDDDPHTTIMTRTTTPARGAAAKAFRTMTTPMPFTAFSSSIRRSGSRCSPSGRRIAPSAGSYLKPCRVTHMAEPFDPRGDLSCWFGLSYSSFLTMPRILMEAMPQEWQEKMARLLWEYNDTYTRWPDGWGTQVQFTVNGKLRKWPEWVLNYRRPDRLEIERLRATAPTGAEPR